MPDFRQHTICAEKINPVVVAVMNGRQQINAVACRGKYLCLLRAAVEEDKFTPHVACQPVIYLAGVNGLMKNTVLWDGVIENHAFMVGEMQIAIMYCQRNRPVIRPFRTKDAATLRL